MSQNSSIYLLSKATMVLGDLPSHPEVQRRLRQKVKGEIDAYLRSKLPQKGDSLFCSDLNGVTPQSMTAPHDSDLCALGKDGGPCEACQWAANSERRPFAEQATYNLSEQQNNPN